MSDLSAACKELVAQGKIEEVFPGVYFVGTLDPMSPEFQEFERSYAEDFERRRREREAQEIEAWKKLQREGPWYF